LISDVPLGAFLSGGLDSSLVVGYMADALPEVRTFSIDFAIEGYSEGRHARTVSELYGTRHEEFLVEPEMVPLATEVAHASGEPFADASAIPTYLLSRLTRAGVTVALSGDGGDEAFGGYERYLHADRADRLAPVRGVARVARGVLPGSARPRARRLGRALELAGRSSQARYAGMMSHFEPAALPALCRSEFLAAANGAGNPWESLLALPPGRGINRYTSLDIATYLPGDLLLKVDRMSMAHALEVRSPMLDHRVHEFAAGLPPSLKLRRGTLKYLLKQVALRRGLPPALVHRRKQGFGVPLGDWFRGELRPWLTDVLTDERTRGRGYFHPAAVDVLIREHISATRDHAPRLWNLVMLELWHRAYIDG
jgi:asparagine synthase (glutamine-hydrolysing)